MRVKKRNIYPATLMLFLFAAFLAAVYQYEKKPSENMNYSEFMKQVESGNVATVILSDGAKIKLYLNDSELIYITDNPRNPGLKELLLLKGIAVSEGSAAASTLQSFISILFFAAAFFIATKVMGQGKYGYKSAMALNAEDAGASGEKQLSFQDIAGNEEAKESVADVVDFIKNPDKYTYFGARMPRGIIFYGQPGTGKTMLAKAIAGEAGVPFYAVSGSDFVQMYVGVGAGRVRELFKKARESKKAVIFIDEIDALGKKRSAQTNGGNDERDQTLNALLTEMSGFSSGEGIVIIAATNRLDTLDEALLRPGRFDRQVEIGLPDVNARKSILNLHAKNKPLAEQIDINAIAKQTVCFSGAMLENLLNEAAISAAKKGTGQICLEDVDKAYYTIIAGSEKIDRSNIRQLDREVTAYHESGHAIVAKLVSPENTVSKITIIPSTKGAGGFCVNIPPDRMYLTKKELENQIMVSFAGRAAEELIFGEENVTTGAGNDIEKATGIIKDYVTKYGMGAKTGLMNISLTDGANKALDECSAILESLYGKTKKLIEDNIKALKAVAEDLLEKETLNEEDLKHILIRFEKNYKL